MLFVERIFKFTFPQMLNEFPDGQEPPTVLCILNINIVILLARVSYSTLYFFILMSFWHPKGFTVIYHQGMDLGSHTLSMVCYLNCMYDLCFLLFDMYKFIKGFVPSTHMHFTIEFVYSTCSYIVSTVITFLWLYSAHHAQVHYHLLNLGFDLFIWGLRSQRLP